MKIIVIIFNFFILLVSSTWTLGQVPKIEPSLYTYQDIQNSKYIGKNIAKLWIVKGALSNNQWNESPEYYEFNSEGRVILSTSQKFKDGLLVTDTAIFTYAQNGLWETKYELGKMTIRDFVYDKKNRLTKIISSDGMSVTYEYSENDRVVKILYNDESWKEFEYLENGQLSMIRTFQKSVLYEIGSYEYENSVVHYTQKNMYDFASDDTVVEYTSYYYNQDTLLVKIVHKVEDSSGWVTSITGMRYLNQNLITRSDCLTNNSSCSYVDYTYDEKGYMLTAIAYSNYGTLMTRSSFMKYEFW